MKNVLNLLAVIAVLGSLFAFVSCKTETDSTETEPTYYTVTFDSAGGSEVAPQTIESGKTVTKPAVPTRDGYTFSAWYNGESEFDFATPITKNITLTAHWEKNTVYYTVTYKSDGYGTAPEAISVAENTVLAAEQLPALSDEGAIFKGWYDGEAKAVAGEYAVTKNVTLTALWSDEAAVSYASKFGAVPTTFVAKLNQTLAAENLSSIDCPPYTFAGWFYEKDEDGNGTGEQAKVGEKVTADITLYAKWQTAIIGFETQFGAVSSTNKYTGEKITEAEIPTLSEAGYAFGGWFKDSLQLTSDYTVTADVTFTALWTANTYTVTFSANGGEGTDTTQNFTFGTAQALTQNTFTRTGYSFTGWAKSENATQAEYADEAEFSTPAQNTALYAVWKANEYTITFEANGGNPATATQKVAFGTTAKLEANSFTRAGYRFASWNTAQDGSGASYSDGGDFAVTEANDITLYAQWVEADRFVITYANTRGAANESPTSYRATEGATLSDLTLTGYLFDGWYSSQDTNGNGTGTKISSWAANEKSGDITLYAKWSPRTDTAYTVEHYKENADDDGFSKADGDTENRIGTTDGATSAKAKSYAHFAAEPVTQGTIAADGSTVVKIYYKRDTMTMTLNLDGGTIGGETSATRTGKYGSSYVAVATPAKQGYTFSAWDPALPATLEDGAHTATYTPNTDTPYKVYHYQENADDDGYTLADTENLSGTTATPTSAPAKTYEHFTAEPVTQTAIAADGSTEVRINYKRETVTFTLDLAGGTLDGEDGTVTKTGKYGQTAIINEPTRMGYTFEGWNTVGGTLPSLYEESAEYTALWTGTKVIAVTVDNSDIPVTETVNGSKITFTADDSFEYFKWYLDDERVSYRNVYTIDTATLETGVYTLALEAHKNSNYYSWFAQITVK